MGNETRHLIEQHEMQRALDEAERDEMRRAQCVTRGELVDAINAAIADCHCKPGAAQVRAALVELREQVR